MKALFDSNIIIDYLNGISQAQTEIARFKTKAITIITYIEVGVGIKDVLMMKKIETFLTTHFEIIPVNQTIANLAIQARQKYKLKIPDSIIFSTAQSINGFLVTRDDKNFPVSDPMVRIPYQI
ncbi:MAG: PIN domain-containing protein [Proteobacteria bacterium]|nr:PIN domain-containing protein [Pseudomonadota bacterium]